MTIEEIEKEQKVLDFASVANTELWKEYSPKQDALIQKFGSRENAMKVTLQSIFDATKKSIR